MSGQNSPKNGEVWLVKLPNQPHDIHQPRTAIIVSTDGRNKMATDVMVVPTTSAKNFHAHPLVHISIPKGEGGLAKDSFARCDQVTTLDKSLLAKGPLGLPIHLKYRWSLINAIRRAIGDTTV